MDAQQSIQRVWIGRLEGKLARHWPERTSLLDLTSVTLLEMLAHYGGPTKLAEDNAAADRQSGWGKLMLKKKKVDTAGVRQDARNIQQIQQCAAMALAAYRQTREARRALKRRHNLS